MNKGLFKLKVIYFGLCNLPGTLDFLEIVKVYNTLQTLLVTLTVIYFIYS